MIGSVISAMMVGFMLEKGDLYASVAAESYLQSGDDEAFWKTLSDEEQVKAREILDKIKSSSSKKETRGESSTGSSPTTGSTSRVVVDSNVAVGASMSEPPARAAAPVQPSKPADMFSDYGD